ncbi:RIP metalloprotease RseP [Candidatus Uhrbacteria bacterium]|nr:RIP metalloprotease RseP [Candidatus Uhrbacteria bacterium]
MIGTILLFLLVLSILVFVHEFGHFVTAKKAGMKVEEFGFGFPPRLWGVKRGDTVYSINWIPLGGFVKIKGESGDQAHDPDSFASKPAWKRFIVLIAGVAMNFLLAGVLLSIGLMVGLPTVVGDDVSPRARVSEEVVHVASVLSESPAARAGVQGGDTLVSIDGTVFTSSDEARAYIRSHSESDVSLSLKRGEGEYVTAIMRAEPLSEAGTVGVGVGLVTTALISYPWYEALVQGFVLAGLLTWEVLRAFGQLLSNLVVHQTIAVDLAGPVGIAVMTGEAAKLGFTYLLQFAAVLSINLAIVNVLPFPALDGGRILFLLIEKIRRRPVNERIEAVVHNLGFGLLMALVLLVTYRDIVRFSGDFLSNVKNFAGG